MKLRFAQDVMIHKRNDNWLISNIRAYTSIEIDFHTLCIIEEYMDNEQVKSTDNLRVKDRTLFTQQYSLMADPSSINDKELLNFNKKNSSCFANFTPKEVDYIYDFDKIINLLKMRKIIIEDEQEYKSYFDVKQNILDFKHIGNFHQRVGYELLKNVKVSPETFWKTQKFNSDDQVLNNLYKYIQDSFFDKFFSSIDLRDKKILDLGCGTGYYSEKLLQLGAEVVGIDPNDDYIKKAEERCRRFDKATFFNGMLEDYQNKEEFDWIIISDMLLFYFVSPDPKVPSNAKVFLKNVSEYLNENGKIFLTEPHGVFWTMPWLGDEEKPFTVVHEYAQKVQKVTPTLEELSSTLYEAGLTIERIFEPKPDLDAREKYSKRAYGYARDFPLWWTFIIKK